MHLTDASYRRLLTRSLPPAAARALSAHLLTDCAACEGFLARRVPADGLDGLVDVALASLAHRAAAAGSGLEFAGIMARVRGRHSA